MMIWISNREFIHGLNVDSCLMNAEFLLKPSILNTCFILKHPHVVFLHYFHWNQLWIFWPLLVRLNQYHLFLFASEFSLCHFLIKLHSLTLFLVHPCILIPLLILFFLRNDWINTSILVKRPQLFFSIKVLLIHRQNRHYWLANCLGLHSLYLWLCL